MLSDLIVTHSSCMLSNSMQHSNISFPFNLQGWTLYEILRYAPQHNWSAYEEALKTHPVLAKMVISGVVYSLGDWIAQVNSVVSTFYVPKYLLFVCLSR